MAVPFSLHLQPRAAQVAAELERALNARGQDLAPAALAIARIEYPALDAPRYLEQIEVMGREAADRVAGLAGAEPQDDALRAFNEYLYDEQGFTGNREHYDDPRNSFLNEVLDRRTGIPISLAVVYIELARRAGLHVEGVNFPGHFLLRAGRSAQPGARADDLAIVDPFHGGAVLSEADCRELLRQHVGDEAAFDRGLLQPATRGQIVTRMLVNLKRLYVRMRSFPQARFISDLLLAVDPSAISELRDRGLLAYHLEDFAAALRDLETYLRLVPRQTDPRPEEHQALEEDLGEDEDVTEVWEHVKNLRKRVAGFN